MKLADNVQDVFGQISPPVPGFGSDNPAADLGNLLSVGLQLVLLVGAALLLLYLLWGAFDWISSAGEKEKLVKAQNKIVNAVIGMVLIIVSFTIFATVTGRILGNKIFVNTPDGWTFNIPTFR